MDLIYFKIVLLLNGWVLAKGSPVAMLQHATSSQSIVFHTDLSDSATTSPNPSSSDRHGSKSAKYEYKYEVSDQQTGDRKSHWESRDGDRVRGVYTLYEPDGALRTVEYTADALHGFNAVVKRSEPNRHQFTNRPSFSHNPNIKNSNGHDTTAGQKSDRNLFSTDSHNRDSDYSGAKSLYTPGVDFSVNHVLNKFRDNDSLY